MGVRRGQEIRARITRRMDLWERGHHAGLVGDAKAEGAAREVRAAFSGKEEDDVVARSFDETVHSGKLLQAVHQATDREGGRVSPVGGQMHKNRVTGCSSPPGEAPGHACAPLGKSIVRSLREV